ncbi:hypothetical protein QR680_001590 [Steinernema hermaphroditum]|uniref:Uncharacterized protein n=1 Tax=Steinernema hermaphroditum TaxID=289476 RepID=A0AA39GYX9_9BILA|nr:hypothetical protein QR680_001590 [Steinernema hermaphroditum]
MKCSTSQSYTKIKKAAHRTAIEKKWTLGQRRQQEGTEPHNNSGGDMGNERHVIALLRGPIEFELLIAVDSIDLFEILKLKHKKH